MTITGLTASSIVRNPLRLLPNEAEFTQKVGRRQKKKNKHAVHTVTPNHPQIYGTLGAAIPVADCTREGGMKGGGRCISPGSAMKARVPGNFIMMPGEKEDFDMWNENNFFSMLFTRTGNCGCRLAG